MVGKKKKCYPVGIKAVLVFTSDNWSRMLNLFLTHVDGSAASAWKLVEFRSFHGDCLTSDSTDLKHWQNFRRVWLFQLAAASSDYRNTVSWSLGADLSKGLSWVSLVRYNNCTGEILYWILRYYWWTFPNADKLLREHSCGGPMARRGVERLTLRLKRFGSTGGKQVSFALGIKLCLLGSEEIETQKRRLNWGQSCLLLWIAVIANVKKESSTNASYNMNLTKFPFQPTNTARTGIKLIQSPRLLKAFMPQPDTR